jgi:hypothetical protein
VFSRLLCCVLGTSMVVACGGGSSGPPTGPTSPTPVVPTTVPSSPTGVRVTGFPRPPGTGAWAATFAGRSETIQWDPTPGATSYRVTIGRVAFASDVFSVETSEPSYVWAAIPLGTAYVNVSARNQLGSSQPSSQIFGVTAFSQQEYIEALFLGTGPLSPSNPNCPGGRNTWAGWQSGTTVTVKLSTTLSSSQREAARTVLSQIESTVGERLRFNILETSETRPRPAAQELTLTQSTDITRDCPPGASACVIPNSDAARIFRTVEGFLDSASNAPLVRHELGHGILGLCHLTLEGDVSFLGMMSAAPAEPVLPLADAEVLRLVYGAGLAPGATRASFVAAGLIQP